MTECLRKTQNIEASPAKRRNKAMAFLKLKLRLLDLNLKLIWKSLHEEYK